MVSTPNTDYHFEVGRCNSYRLPFTDAQWHLVSFTLPTSQTWAIHNTLLQYHIKQMMCHLNSYRINKCNYTNSLLEREQPNVCLLGLAYWEIPT